MVSRDAIGFRQRSYTHFAAAPTTHTVPNCLPIAQYFVYTFRLPHNNHRHKDARLPWGAPRAIDANMCCAHVLKLISNYHTSGVRGKCAYYSRRICSRLRLASLEDAVCNALFFTAWRRSFIGCFVFFFVLPGGAGKTLAMRRCFIYRKVIILWCVYIYIRENTKCAQLLCLRRWMCGGWLMGIFAMDKHNFRAGKCVRGRLTRELRSSGVSAGDVLNELIKMQRWVKSLGCD